VTEPFPTLARVRTPSPVRWVARTLVVVFLAFPVALLFVPWQQTVRGRGQIIAYAATERRQIVTARIGGQISKWHVTENDRVKAGQRIVDIEDNDPDLAARLETERNFLKDRLKAAKLEVDEQKQAVAAQEKALKAAVSAATANVSAAERMVDVARQTKRNNEFAVTFEKLRFQMFDTLFQDKKFGGLESQLNRDEAKMRADRADTDVLRAAAEIDRAEAARTTSQAQVLQAEAAGLTALATNRRDQFRAEQNLFGVEQSIQQIDSRIERFKARFVTAPCDGVVHRVLANSGGGGQLVKEGDELAEIVPDTTDRVVEVFVDGVDAPLIAAHIEETGRGPHVRLQFEGWPAVQFAGWPSVATGTFGGRVRQIDPTDDGYGRFRVLVEPDRLFDEDDWPEDKYLRQGNQAVGWVFLNRVTLGYELWRQFNGFPPVVAPKAPDKSKKDGGKPPKVKPAG
jgi:membrane fusion protein, adhesin transport system